MRDLKADEWGDQTVVFDHNGASVLQQSEFNKY
jgi:hypothetical protein